MPHYTGPLLTAATLDALRHAAKRGEAAPACSLALGHGTDVATTDGDGFTWRGTRYPFPDALRDRTIYYWDGEAFVPLQRYGVSLIKLVPTEWGPPTFEIDGIKMLPSAQVSPWEDAQRKVALVQPRGKTVLDCCGGLGYFAACCLADGAARIISVEKNPDVLWLRQHNPWSPDPEAADAGGRLQLLHGDILQHITTLADASVDAVLHDPPRFGIAGDLYSQAFYDELFRVLRPGGRLFHYTGTPNRKTSGRDVPGEVATRLGRAGFTTERVLDGVYATRGAPRRRR